MEASNFTWVEAWFHWGFPKTRECWRWGEETRQAEVVATAFLMASGSKDHAQLIKLVDLHSPRNWSLISAGFPGRSGKSCRLRWCNQLSPAVQHRPFTPAEDAAIVAAHAKHGNK
ncbi:hypothetical protein Taro_009176 [Colocasia esculenta]|uniref:Uncharacterized protein n=1 Tax=Colocasia esculenta TaxID=4460 RepID=A0A843U085_COLES|nr:hypothetical protein [Colocasia esculenta]